MEQASRKSSLGVDKGKKSAFLSCVNVLLWDDNLLEGPLGSVLHSTKDLEHADYLIVIF